MKKRLYVRHGLLIVILLMALPAVSCAEIALMDGKLTLSGFIKNTTYYRTSTYSREFDKGKEKSPGGINRDNHDSNFTFSNFSALLEVLYTVQEDQQSSLRLFASMQPWYEASSTFDKKNRRSLYTKHRKEYQYPTKFEDWVSEAYVDYTTGPWQVRVGKQIVIWGQLDMNRVADVVNPLDLRRGVPGIDTWEEVKQGLWMIRTFYQSQLPGNLLFEFIFNPGDYKAIRLSYEGTHWGPEYFKNVAGTERDRGYFSWQHEKFIQDEPGWSLSNYEFGGRVQGFTWNIDWTLIYWNALDDGPSNINVARSIQLAGDYFGGGPLPSPHSYGKVYKYKRFQTIGGTAQTFTVPLKDTVWRLEWFWEIDRPITKGLQGNPLSLYDGNDRCNILGIALQANWYWRIPWFTRHVGKGQQLQTSLTYFNERVLDYDKDMILFERFYKPGSSTMESLTLFIMQQMFNASWTFVFIGNYFPQNGRWMAVPTLTYMFADSGPFSGFRFDMGVKLYGGAQHKYFNRNMLSHMMDHKDSVILRLRYEF
jgi:hypothetical protein